MEFCNCLCFQTEVFETTQTTIFNQTSTISFVPESTGLIICTATNDKSDNGMSEVQANVIVMDLSDELAIWSNSVLPISVGDDVSVTCGASAHKYATELNWFKDDVPVESGGSTYYSEVSTNLCSNFVL